MKTYYYYNVLRKHIIMFLDLFNDIQIARYNRSGVVNSYIKVPLKFAPKEKIWYWINERKDDETLPMMSVLMNSCEHASDRIGSRLDYITSSVIPSAGNLSRLLNPIPYNIGFTLSIWALHMVDVDQILEQILPFFNPNAFMRIKISELDVTINTKVIFQSCAPDLTDTMSDEESRVVKWNLEFMVHGHLFRPISEPGLIKKIITKLYKNDSAWDNYKFTESTYTSGASGHEAESMYFNTYSPWYDENSEILSSYEIFGGKE